MLTTPDHQTSPGSRRSSNPPAAGPTGDTTARVAGLGALTFVAVVLVQNLVRGAFAPQAGAASPDVLRYYADHRAISVLLSATFVLSGLGLAVFLGGAVRRLVRGPRPGWAITGLAGALGILALFSVLVGSESALSAVAGGTAPSASAVDALWALHNGVFGALLLSIGIALLGLARAGTAAGITPRAFDWLAPLGCALLGLGAAAGPLLAAGDAMAIFALSGLGFLIWLAFLASTGGRLIRHG